MTPCRLLLTTLVALAAGDCLRGQGPPGGFTPGFAGRSRGDGTLRLLLGTPRPFHVESFGRDRPDGRFQLDQTVTFRGEPPTTRTWVMTPTGPGRYAATLTDAAGPVSLRTAGNQLFLRYRYKGPFVVRQTLTQRPDGRTIDNVGRVTLLGVPVARLRETITRGD